VFGSLLPRNLGRFLCAAASTKRTDVIMRAGTIIYNHLYREREGKGRESKTEIVTSIQRSAKVHGAIKNDIFIRIAGLSIDSIVR